MYEFEKKKLKSYLGEKLYDELKSYNAYIAGGTVTSLFCNREINDIDIYFRNQKDLVEFLEDSWCSKFWVVAHTKKATLIKYDNELDIQLIHFNYFETAQDIFKTFDFTACMGAFDFNTEEFILHEDFLKHNSQRLLQFNSKTAFPLVSALRVQKYKEKGYSISKPEYIRILLTCMNLNINTYGELKEQMGGMYGINCDKLFKEEKEFSLENALSQLEDLCIDDDYFKEPIGNHFEEVEDLIASIQGTKPRCVKLNNKYYRINQQNALYKEVTHDIQNSLGERLNIGENIEEISAEEFMKDKKFYKFVKKVGDRYYSYYDYGFEYKLNQEAIPTGKVSYCNSLFCGEFDDIDRFSYVKNDDKALLELIVKPEDFKHGCGNSIEVSKCTPVREVPKEEYEYILK